MSEKKPNTVTCPICGEQIERGVPYHTHSLGGICIIDAEKAKQDGHAITVGR